MNNETMSVRKQKDLIDKFRIAVAKRYRIRYPKIAVVDTEGGYTVQGYVDSRSEAEEVVDVCEASKMSRRFFMECILGPIGYFYGVVPDYEVKCFLDNGRFYDNYKYVLRNYRCAMID